MHFQLFSILDLYGPWLRVSSRQTVLISMVYMLPFSTICFY